MLRAARQTIIEENDEGSGESLDNSEQTITDSLSTIIQTDYYTGDLLSFTCSKGWVFSSLGKIVN